MIRAPRLATLCVCFAVASSGCADADPGDRRAPESDGNGQAWAVVVGISAYHNFPTLDDGVSRAERMRTLFSTTWEVPREHMRVLLDDDATRTGVRESLVEWLPEVASPDDEVLVFLSGYGSTIEDLSGDEEDGLDEGFCTVDALVSSYANDILDDSLSLWMDRLPTERVTLIVESDRFGQGDHDPHHPGHEEHARRFPAGDAVAVTRCGHRPIR